MCTSDVSVNTDNTAVSSTTASRSWFCVLTNPQAIYNGEPSEIAEQALAEWVTGHPTRTGAVAYCISAAGLIHLHLVLEDFNKARFSAVKSAYPKAHIEPTQGNKSEAESYIQKTGKYAEKGEQVIYIARQGEIIGRQGKRRDIDLIADLLKAGKTPNEIYDVNFTFRRYADLIKAEFFRLRKRSTPRIREVTVYWHVGESRTGKTFEHSALMDKYGDDEVYLLTDYRNGFDLYNGEKVLFMEEFRGQMQYNQLLIILDKYRAQIGARYANIMALWTEVHITSVFPPERVYSNMVKEHEDIDTLTQLMRRISYVVYHWVEGDEFKRFEIPASEYHDYRGLRVRATTPPTVFEDMPDDTPIPFSFTQTAGSQQQITTPQTLEEDDGQLPF
jgi:hypothetical protein